MFGRKGHTIRGLDAQGLDAIVQHLAKYHDWLWPLGGSPYFRVTPFVWWTEEDGRYAGYRISFTYRDWKKLRKELTDNETETVLLGGIEQ